MQNENLKFKIFEEKNLYGFEKVTKIDQKIYQKRKSETSQRSFGFERTRKVDFGTLSKNF